MERRSTKELTISERYESAMTLFEVLSLERSESRGGVAYHPKGTESIERAMTNFRFPVE